MYVFVAVNVKQKSNDNFVLPGQPVAHNPILFILESGFAEYVHVVPVTEFVNVPPPPHTGFRILS